MNDQLPATKTYTVTYGPTFWECTVVIDQTPETEIKIKDMVEFWAGGPGRVRENNGNYTKTFLQQLAQEINAIQVEFDYNLEGVIEEFDNREGWYKMDGSCGITITDIDDFEFAFSDYEVVEAPVA